MALPKSLGPGFPSPSAMSRSVVPLVPSTKFPPWLLPPSTLPWAYVTGHLLLTPPWLLPPLSLPWILPLFASPFANVTASLLMSSKSFKYLSIKVDPINIALSCCVTIPQDFILCLLFLIISIFCAAPKVVLATDAKCGSNYVY